MRRVICLLLGIAAGTFAYKQAANLTHPRDFAQVWFAARTVLDGGDPYALIGPGRAFDWPNGYFYPMPATLLAVPLAPLPVEWACAVFAGIGGALFAWALSREGYGPLIGFGGASAAFAFETAQWSPLLAAAVAVPAVGVVLAAKPTIGAAIFAARPSWWALAGGVALLAASFAVDPGWLEGWRAALADTSLGPTEDRIPYLAPVMMPGGVLVLAALTRWRRWEARLLVAMACVPQTLLLYEAVPIFLVARSWRESALLVFTSWLVVYLLGAFGSYDDLQSYVLTSGQVMTPLLYLPALAMVLRRPNTGPAPAWLERAMRRAPAWLRGNPEGGSSTESRPRS